MKVPLEITFRGVKKTKEIEDLIREKAVKLDRLSDALVSCRVAVEEPQAHQQSGSFYRVRVEMGVPGDHLVLKRESGEGDMHETLSRVIRDVFDVAGRQLREYMERQRGEVKRRPEVEEMAFVVRLFKEEGYGFIKAPDGREIYFHQNAVPHGDFDRLEVGTGVRFVESKGEEGPQASTIQIVDKPGARLPENEESAPEPPLGWEQ